MKPFKESKFKLLHWMAVFVVGWLNFLLVLAINEMPGTGSIEIVLPFVLGCGAAEISALAIVVGLVKGGGWRRFAFAAVTLLLWLLAYLLALKIIDDSMQIELVVVVVAVSVAAVLIYQFPIAVYRFVTQKRLEHYSFYGKSRAHSNQFQIRHLLIITTGLAVFITATKFIFDKVDAVNGRIPWWELIFFFATFIIIVAAVLIPSLLIVFESRQRHQVVGFLVATLIVVGPAAAFVGLSVAFRGRGLSWDLEEFFDDAYLGTCAFIAGNVLVTILFLLLARTLGYRLIKSDLSKEVAK